MGKLTEASGGLPETLSDTPAVVSVPEAGRVFGIGKNTAYDLARRGEFPAPVIKIGRRMFVLKSQLRRAIDGELTVGR